MIYRICRYYGKEDQLESIVLDYSQGLIHKKMPDIPRNLMKSLSAACGLPGVRSFVVTRIEQWLHSSKVGRFAQDLLMYLAVNVGCSTVSDIEILTHLCTRLKMKTKPLLNFYCIAVKYVFTSLQSTII